MRRQKTLRTKTTNNSLSDRDEKSSGGGSCGDDDDGGRGEKVHARDTATERARNVGPWGLLLMPIRFHCVFNVPGDLTYSVLNMLHNLKEFTCKFT